MILNKTNTAFLKEIRFHEYVLLKNLRCTACFHTKLWWEMNP